MNAVCKMLEFCMSALVLKQLSAFELKAWLGITLFMSYFTDILFGAELNILKIICIITAVIGLVFIAVSSKDGKVNYKQIIIPLAMENNLSETAFIVKEEKGYHLRWFTPGTEVELCGHATLASSYVILNFYEPDSSEVKFNTLSGELTIRRKENLYEMDFPTYELKEIPVTDAMEKAFGARPVKAVLGLDLVCVFDSEDIVRNMNPDQVLLTGIEGRIQNATARGTETDCVSRSFCPKLSIAEDPVCGSAHCQIAAFWAEQLNKKEIYAYQASKRGGYLHCRIEGNKRITISGEAALAAVSEIVAEL